MRKREVNLKADKNKRDKETKMDREEIKIANSNSQKRGDLEGSGKTEKGRTKQDKD